MNREGVDWHCAWQEEVGMSYVASDSDWGGNLRTRKSTLGGAWMIGAHLIKTWSAAPGPYALSSGEAELYGLVEGVTRAKD